LGQDCFVVLAHLGLKHRLAPELRESRNVFLEIKGDQFGTSGGNLPI
jgi:hypothetical protein